MKEMGKTRKDTTTSLENQPLPGKSCLYENSSFGEQTKQPSFSTRSDGPK